MVVLRGVNIYPAAIEKIVRSMDDIDEYQVELFTENDMAEMRIRIESSGGADSCKELQRCLQQALFIRVPVELSEPGSLPRYEMKAKRWVKLDQNKGNES
jgi:phenylacetate-CoA ligase